MPPVTNINYKTNTNILTFFFSFSALMNKALMSAIAFFWIPDFWLEQNRKSGSENFRPGVLLMYRLV